MILCGCPRRALENRTTSRHVGLACIAVVGFVIFPSIRGWTALRSGLWPRIPSGLIGIRQTALGPRIVLRAVCGLRTIRITEARYVVDIDISSMTGSWI